MTSTNRAPRTRTGGKAARHAAAGTLERAIATYRAAFDDWGEIATWPLESGLVHIARRLRGGL